LNTTVVDVDVKKKEIKLENGSKINYDKVLIATGGRAKKMSLDKG